ncbi:hypothetical protein C1646_749606 [Rhizophagus diaphanus]|nr:hypothetical protein C1646_749606 [Rhizophagus diaphanus] [Rhizophagus sp. MUCL 43196]
MDNMQLEKGFATNTNKNVKNSAKIPVPIGSELLDDLTGTYLSDYLQRTLDNLTKFLLAFYNNLKKNEDKVTYLKSMQEQDWRVHRKGI